MELIWKIKKTEIDSPLRRAEAIADSMGLQDLKDTVDFLQVILKHNNVYEEHQVGSVVVFGNPNGVLPGEWVETSKDVWRRWK